MSNEDVKAAVCREALATLSECPSAILPHLRGSVEAQLHWLIDYFEGRSNDRQRLYELTFGHCAVRELDPRDEKLVAALNKAYYVAVKTRQGLKIDLQLLGYCS